MASATRTERDEAIEKLHEILKPGDTVHTVVTHVARSGMSRSIRAIVVKDNEPIDISWLVARLGIGRMDRDNGGVRMTGAGMDMGFALVYDLSYHLFPGGFGCIGERCPSNDHSNGDRDYTPHMNGAPNTFTPGYVGHWHRDGGYALRHRWL